MQRGRGGRGGEEGGAERRWKEEVKLTVLHCCGVKYLKGTNLTKY